MLAPGGEVDSASAFATLALESRGLYREFVRELQESTRVAIDYQECGALDLAYSAAEWNDLEARAGRQATLGIAAKKLSRKQLETFWPRVRATDFAGALFYPDDAIVNPRDLVLALSAACRALNVEIVQDSAVESVEIADRGALIECGGRIRKFDAIVIAAGAWSSSVRMRNVPPLPASEPVKGHLVGFHQPDQTCNTILRHGHTYLLQRANGLLIAGASVENVGWDRGVDPEISRSLARDAEFVLPHLAETSPSESWIGFRPASESLQMGPWHSKRLYLAYGHYRNGILLAPVTAQEIARAVSANWGMQQRASV